METEVPANQHANVTKNVQRMMLCRDSEGGYARYFCLGCRFDTQTSVLQVAPFLYREVFRSITT